MGIPGRFTPNQWGPFLPAHNSISFKGPWYYRNTEMVMLEFETDPDAILDILPSDLELYEPATGFMVIERNHWTTIGPYSEVYLGLMCLWKGAPHAFVPGVYVTGENSQLVGREVWGFGKKRPHSIDLVKHDDGSVEALMQVKAGDRSLRASVRPHANAPADSLGEIPLVVLRIVPDAEGGGVPALAQLVSVTFRANPVMGSDGKAEIFTGPGVLDLEDPSDVKVPVKKVHRAFYARFDADLPYGKVLKTFTKQEILSYSE